MAHPRRSTYEGGIMSDSIRFAASAGQPQLPTAATAQGKAAAAAMPAPAPASQAPAKPTVPKVDPQKMLNDLKEIVDRMNQEMKANNRNLGFALDDSVSNSFVVTVRDSNTGEVVRQIPNEVVVKFAHNLENLKGVLFNESL